MKIFDCSFSVNDEISARFSMEPCNGIKPQVEVNNSNCTKPFTPVRGVSGNSTKAF